ncbi:MAG: hypothetical protein L3V56_14140, partial [Candidatus Magnetoovum sp. WYHC-5]|nr:hypothetical protein [Candidatus Magnetoovum sp. WYHC-5]
MANFEIPSIDIRYGQYNGTKTNSYYFWYYLKELYDWREKTGLIPNIKKIDSITIQVDIGTRVEAIKEILLMAAYDYLYTFENEHYVTSVLEYKKDLQVPAILIREPKGDKQRDIFALFNTAAENRKGSLKRYIGESYLVSDIDDVFNIQNEAGTWFFTNTVQGSKTDGLRWIETQTSIYTQNTVRYVQYYNN